MIVLVKAEFQKLHGSLALLVAVAAPALPGFLAMLALLTNDEPASWSDSFRFALPLWCLFLAPMVIAAFTALAAQIEHRGQGWDHLLALPIARWHIYAAKIAVIFAAALMMTVLVIGFTVLGTLIGGEFGIALPQEPFPWRNLAWQTLLIFASTAALVALQSWIALRFANFVVPLVLGISGTLVAMAVMMTRTQQADWFPWVLPYKALIEHAPVPYAVAGAVGGLFIIIITIVDLSKREVR